MEFQIKHRNTRAVLFEGEFASLKQSVEAAVKSGANLCGADLHSAYLRGADLRGAYLRGANLGGANLGGANLGGANLGGADLGRVTWCGATIDGAILRPSSIGGPGHILWALTDEEDRMVRAGRA